jgi:hypothetical protein
MEERIVLYPGRPGLAEGRDFSLIDKITRQIDRNRHAISASLVHLSRAETSTVRVAESNNNVTKPATSADRAPRVDQDQAGGDETGS